MMKKRKIPIVLVTVLLLNMCSTKEDCLVHAISMKMAKNDYMMLYYEMCQELPEFDWSYCYIKRSGELIPYFAMKAEAVNSAWGYVYLKHASSGNTIRVVADEAFYGKNYILLCEWLLKYKGMHRANVWLYKISQGKIIKYRSKKTITGKTSKKMLKNLDKWLTKTIRDSGGIQFKKVKWKY